MRNTVTQPPGLRDLPDFDPESDAKGLARYLTRVGGWLRYWMQPWTRQVDVAVNRVYVTEASLTTTGTAVFETIWTSETMRDGTIWTVDVDVMARASVGTAARARYIRRAIFYREGSVAQQGASFDAGDPSWESVAGWDVQFALGSSNNVAFQVKGDGARTVQWKALVSLRELPLPVPLL